MKRMYARFVLWLIKPAIDQEKAESRGDGVISQQALEAFVRAGRESRGRPEDHLRRG